MTQTTPKLALVKPGGGSTGLNTPPDRVDIDVINGNFDKIDAFATKVGDNTDRSVQYFGPAANIGTTTPKLGDEYQESDGNKQRWRYDGSNWVSGDYGLVRVRPTSVSGAALGSVTILPSGSVQGAHSAGGRLNIDGVFNFAKYKRYKVIHNFRKGTNTAEVLAVQFRAAGADKNTAGYWGQAIHAIGAVTTPGVYTISSGTQMTGLFDASGFVVSSELTVAGTDTGELVSMYGQVMGRRGGFEMRTASGSFEAAGANVSNIDGLALDYQQSYWCQWTFYAYVE